MENGDKGNEIMKYVLQGEISDWCSAGEDSGLGISGVPLAMWSENNFDRKCVTVKWWTADEELSESDRITIIAEMQCGITQSEFYGSYSEYTGHLWTNEGFKVGGHDMLEILRNYIGKWCYLEVLVDT
jgi:hypothetical protein